MKTIKKSTIGQGLVEYALIIVLIAIVVIVAIEAFNVDVGAIVGSLPQGDEAAVQTEEVSGPVDEVAEIEFTATPLPTIPPTATLPLPTNTSIPTSTVTPTPTETVLTNFVFNQYVENTLNWLISVAEESGCTEAEFHGTLEPGDTPIVIGHSDSSATTPVYLRLYLCEDETEQLKTIIVFDKKVLFAARNATDADFPSKYNWGDYMILLADYDYPLIEGVSPKELASDFSCKWILTRDNGFEVLWVIPIPQYVFDLAIQGNGYVPSNSFYPTCEE